METKIEMSRMYDTLLATPGMNQSVKDFIDDLKEDCTTLKSAYREGIVRDWPERSFRNNGCITQGEFSGNGSDQYGSASQSRPYRTQ
jgi:hypothetical protein